MNGTNTIQTLRDELFATLQDLRAGKIDVSTAKAVGEIGQTIINSAKAELDFMRQTGQGGTGFVPALEAPTPAAGERTTPTGTVTPTPTGVVHRMR